MELLVESRCSYQASSDVCTDDPSAANLASLPLNIAMTDNDNGTYSATLNTSEMGDVSISAKIYASGLTAKYYSDYNFSDLQVTQIDPNINLYFQNEVSPLTKSDYLSVVWEGFYYVEFSGDYEF